MMPPLDDYNRVHARSLRKKDVELEHRIQDCSGMLRQKATDPDTREESQ